MLPTARLGADFLTKETSSVFPVALTQNALNNTTRSFSSYLHSARSTALPLASRTEPSKYISCSFSTTFVLPSDQDHSSSLITFATPF